MNVQEINKTMISVYKLLSDIEEREIDNVYKSYVLYACLRLQHQVYDSLLSMKLVMKAINFSIVQPSMQEIYVNQGYLYLILKQNNILSDALKSVREEYLCKM